jgi:hypothetical protein
MFKRGSTKVDHDVVGADPTRKDTHLHAAKHSYALSHGTCTYVRVHILMRTPIMPVHIDVSQACTRGHIGAHARPTYYVLCWLDLTSNQLPHHCRLHLFESAMQQTAHRQSPRIRFRCLGQPAKTLTTPLR